MGFWASDRLTSAAKYLYMSIFLDDDIFLWYRSGTHRPRDGKYRGRIVQGKTFGTLRLGTNVMQDRKLITLALYVKDRPFKHGKYWINVNMYRRRQ